MKVDEVIDCLEKNKTKYGFKFNKVKGKCVARASITFMPQL